MVYIVIHQQYVILVSKKKMSFINMNIKLPFPQVEPLEDVPFVGAHLEYSPEQVSCIKSFSEAYNIHHQKLYTFPIKCLGSLRNVPLYSYLGFQLFQHNLEWVF